MRPAQQRERVGFLIATFGIAISRACDLIRLNRSTYYVKSTARPFNAMFGDGSRISRLLVCGTDIDESASYCAVTASR